MSAVNNQIVNCISLEWFSFQHKLSNAKKSNGRHVLYYRSTGIPKVTSTCTNVKHHGNNKIHAALSNFLV